MHGLLISWHMMMLSRTRDARTRAIWIMDRAVRSTAIYGSGCTFRSDIWYDMLRVCMHGSALRGRQLPVICSFYLIFMFLCYFKMYALHTQYIVRTDILFLWMMCSCPQVDRETTPLPRSQLSLHPSTFIDRRCRLAIFFCVHIWLWWGPVPSLWLHSFG